MKNGDRTLRDVKDEVLKVNVRCENGEDGCNGCDDYNICMLKSALEDMDMERETLKR